MIPNFMVNRAEALYDLKKIDVETCKMRFEQVSGLCDLLNVKYIKEYIQEWSAMKNEVND